MNTSILARLALTFGTLSLFSVGGANATLPEIHRQVVEQLHWMDNATFSKLVAIGQTAPGPNVLVVSMIGWQVAGFAGMTLATLAIVLPSSLLVFGVARVMTRYEHHRWTGLVRRALAPVAVGLMLASGVVMVRAAYEGLLTVAIAAVMAIAIYFTRMSPFWGVAGAAVLGILVHRLDLV